MLEGGLVSKGGRCFENSFFCFSLEIMQNSVVSGSFMADTVILLSNMKFPSHEC